MARLTDPIGPNICPNCGERVSAFAAGCAHCGTELDPTRGSGPPTITRRLSNLWAFVRTRFERGRR